MLAGGLAVVILMMRAWPELPLSRFLHAMLVERPVRWWADARRVDFIFVIAVLLVAVSAGGMVAAFGSDFLLAYSLDLALYIDAVVFGSLIATAGKIARATRPIIDAIPRPRTVRRRIAARVRRVRKVASPDDGDGGRYPSKAQVAPRSALRMIAALG